MAAIVLSDLAGATVTYGDLQFGGADSAHKSVPPTYRFRGDFVWDDARRVVKAVKYTLQVVTIFHENNEHDLALNVESVREILSVPGRELRIEGLGTGFGTVSPYRLVPELGETLHQEIEWGPKPIFFDWHPLGQLAWECVWAVEFTLSECQLQHPENAWLAFNFDTTWHNDFEGMCSRTISGHVEIATLRNPENLNMPKYIADGVRDALQVILPVGFRRVNNVWREGAAKNRLDFVIHDEQLPGDVLPPGVTMGDGEATFESAGPGFAEATYTMSMHLKTAPDQPRSLAGVMFLIAAITKQNAMQAANPKGSVIAAHLRISNGKFNRSRDTSCSMSWAMTKCLNEMMLSAGIWEPVSPNDYSAWRASMSALWGNRGFSGLRSNINDAVIINLCSGVTSASIGDTPVTALPYLTSNITGFTCPDIPEDGGWLGHDLRVRLLRADQLTVHKKAKLYLPQAPVGGSPGQGNPGERIPIGGPPYSQTAAEDKHLVEHHGLPVNYVMIQFRALRAKHKPVMPELNSVAGITAVHEMTDIDGPRHAFDVLTCPVWFLRGYRIYRINGYVPDIAPTETPNTCSNITDPGQTQNY